MRRFCAFFVAGVICLSLLGGCTGKKDELTTNSGGGGAFNELGNMVDDSSDMPDWTGKKISLRYWFAQGTASVKRLKKAENDVVTPEIFRVTGVKYDDQNSFDNGGELMDAKISKIMAANDWPDVIVNCEQPILEKLIESDLVYELSELIPKYCPNILAMANRMGDDNYLKSKRKDGKIYTLPFEIMSYAYASPDLGKDVLIKAEKPVDPLGYVYVRDDILKMIYPKAKSQDEIEALYMKNGVFTKEEMLDVPLNSKEDFFKFLYKIKELGLKEGNREVYPFFVADGLDNWSLLTNLGFLYGYNLDKGADNNYFTYWDKETKKVEYMFEQGFFKEAMRDYTRLVQDEVASPDSIVDNRATFEQNINNGLYAVIYGATSIPNSNILNSRGKSYKYRKVYVNIPLNEKKFLFTKSADDISAQSAVILKKNIKEADLPQILRFFDFALSDAGQKLAYWGPRSSGLWSVIDSKRKFTDANLEGAMVYDNGNGRDVYYNLKNTAWPGYPLMGSSRYDPKIVYDVERKPTLADKFFNMGLVQNIELTNSIAPNIWKFNAYKSKSTLKFWSARQAFEDALKKILIAKDDVEFEKLYKAMLEVAKENGLTEEAKDELNKLYREVINANYMSNLE